jgi:NTE family protein
MNIFKKHKLKKIKPLRIGIVFDGGGARGPYQLGVYFALKKFGLEKNIIGVSGASIGAFSSCLIQLDSPSRIIHYCKQIDNDLVRGKKGNIISSLKNTLIKGEGLYHRDNLKQFLDSSLDLGHLLKNAKYPVYISLAKENKNANGEVTSYSPVYKLINEKSHADIVTLLLATSAIPKVFDPVEYQGDTYVDPMKGDNEPYTPLLKLKPDLLFIIPLNDSHFTHEYKEDFPVTIVDFCLKEMMDLPRMNMIDFNTDNYDYYLSLGYQTGRFILSYLDYHHVLDDLSDYQRMNNKPAYYSLNNMGINDIKFDKMDLDDIFKDMNISVPRGVREKK